jgi:DNA-binding XRE family transcriptional regulator
MRRSYPTNGCLLMVRAPKCSRTVGAALFDSNIVSFRSGHVKRFALLYYEKLGSTKVQRTSHLKRLKEHRQRRGLTQIELAKISDVGRATIADLEAGKRGAYQSTVKKLARALKVKAHDLEGE